MYLERIEIQGFKSFAQKTVLAFGRSAQSAVLDSKKDQPGIACIVGPNGSGKSNVVDAIRWVLGEQSLKSLRGKKSEDVIFSGSEKKSRLGMAEVSLVINNRDGIMPVDYEEVAISRKLYRNGESEYFVNKTKVRLQDVIMLLAQANFGQKSYSIVSQGSIDQVIMSTPADRKDYFDEAVGVKQFQIKRDQSINKLETSWNNLRQVDALLTEVTPRLASLTRQVKRLERREKVEAELRELQQGYFGFLWQQLANSIKEVSPKLEVEIIEQKKLEQALNDFRSKLRAMETQDSRSTVFDQLQQKYQAVLEEKNRLREEQLMLQNKIELAKQRVIHRPSAMPLTDIISRLKEIKELHAKIISDLETASPASLAQAKADASDLAVLVSNLMSELESPKAKQQEPAEVDPQLLADLADVQTDLTAIESRLNEARSAMEKFNEQEEKKKGAFFDIQREITKAQDLYNAAASRVSSLRVEQARLETRQQDLQREIIDELQSLDWLKEYKVKEVNESESRGEIFKLKRQLELIGGVDPEVVNEYQQTKERFDFLSTQAEDLRSSISEMEKVIIDLDDKIQEQFDNSFKHINKSFSKFFNILFDGGKAELILIKEDPSQTEIKKENSNEDDLQGENYNPGILEALSEAEEKLSPRKFLKKRTGKVISGIDIVATPPGKKVSSITMLSGGERSLASIALICAVIANNPSPFVILDEVDAALDEANSQRFAKIVGELADKTQFIVITHNRATMHQASILYGITMGDDGISKLISLKLEEAQNIVRQ
jgi:chromosome segregation protein